MEHYEQEHHHPIQDRGDSILSSTSLMEISKPTDFKRGVHIAIDQENGVLKGELISDNLLIRFLHNKLYLMIIMIVD